MRYFLLTTLYPAPAIDWDSVFVFKVLFSKTTWAVFRRISLLLCQQVKNIIKPKKRVFCGCFFVVYILRNLRVL